MEIEYRPLWTAHARALPAYGAITFMCICVMSSYYFIVLIIIYNRIIIV